MRDFFEVDGPVFAVQIAQIVADGTYKVRIVKPYLLIKEFCKNIRSANAA
jgi:hypothetical protein